MVYQGTTGRFVGRAEELARLRHLLAYTADGQPLVALVSGEAGVGKTRPRSTCPWPAPRWTWASETSTPPRPGCGPPSG
jgi:hypothetical protein